jgi:NAD(P)-dependent dehydrogenase (short-subunit alcohol dehydrogenase family)
MALALNGKVGIITGANQGLGFEIAKAFLLAGANLMICARNEALLHEALLKLHSFATSEQRLYAQVCDVSKEADVKALVERTIEIFSELHILVNNAGIYGPKGETESVNWGEWIRAMEINVFGSVLMCRETLSYFKGQKFGKIIQLSGGGATNPMPRISAYAVSKAAIVRFSETLAEEVREFGIDVNCIAPGALNTRMLDEILEAGPEKVGQVFYDRSLKQRDTGGASMQRGAELAVFLASEASNGITGKLISAVWDNWSEWPKHLNELSASDVYTLRRITGRDRSMDWGEIL